MRKLLVITLVFLVIALPAGCGKTADTKDSGTNAPLSDKGQPSNNTDKNTEADNAAKMSDEELKGLIPLYKVDKIYKEYSPAEGWFAVVYNTKASLDDVKEYYKDFFKDAEHYDISDNGVQVELLGMIKGVYCTVGFEPAPAGAGASGINVSTCVTRNAISNGDEE